MLQFIREKAQGWIAWVIIGILSITFALWGIQNYSGNGNQHDVLATVNGIPITRQAVENKYQRLQDAFQAKFGLSALNEKIQSSMQQQALQQLITSQVLAQANAHDGYHLAPNLLGQAVISIPYFQKEGKFSSEQYERVLAHIGFSKESFLAELEQSILNSQIQFGIQRSAFVLPNEIADSFQLRNQKRDIAYLIIPNAQVAASEQVIQQYYQTHAEQFKNPEKISIDYIRLTANQLKKKVTVTDAQVKEFYTNNSDLYHDKDFASVQAAVRNNLIQQKLQQLYAQATEDLAELSYTNPDSLNSIAQTYALPIQTTGFFTRQGGERNTITADAKIIAAAFSDEVILHRNNSTPIPLDQESMVVLHVKQYEPASVRPLAEVRETIMHLLSAELEQKQARELSEQLASDLQQAKVSPAEIAGRYHLQWNKKIHIDRHASDLQKQVLGYAFQATTPQDHHPSFSAFSLDQNHSVLIEIDAIYPGAATGSAQELEKMHQQIEETYAEEEYNLYVKSKMAKAKIVIFKKP